MKGDGNKYLNTLNRIFGPAVKKAMPVMLKVALGSVGVLFVAALVLMYSDKRYVEGWTHSESMGFMLMKLVTFLLYLIPIGLGCVILWWLLIVVINWHFERRKPQGELERDNIQVALPSKELKVSKPLAPIDEDKLKPYFKASFKGMGQNINHFPDLIRELEHIRKGSATDVGRAAYMIYNSSHMTKKPQTFAKWMRAFFEILDVPVPKDMSQNKYEPTKEIKDRLYFLQ